MLLVSRLASSTTTTAQALVDRRVECARLDHLLADARTGTSAAVVVRGEAGVGKSALLEYLLLHAVGCRVVRTAGSESEMELPFATLHRLNPDPSAYARKFSGRYSHRVVTAALGTTCRQKRHRPSLRRFWTSAICQRSKRP